MLYAMTPIMTRACETRTNQPRKRIEAALQQRSEARHRSRVGFETFSDADNSELSTVG